MAFLLPTSLETGIGHLDDEHRGLVTRVNLIAEAECAADTSALVGELVEFKADLVGHFHGEEANLEALGYPALDSHARHHSEIVATLDRLIRDLQCGAPIQGGVAHICFHELVSVVLRRDMEFINWLAERQARGTPDPG